LGDIKRAHVDYAVTQSIGIEALGMWGAGVAVGKMS